MPRLFACLLATCLLGACAPYGPHGCVIECLHAQQALPGVPSRLVSIGFRGLQERHVVLVFRTRGGWKTFDPQSGTFLLFTPRDLPGFPPPLTVARIVRPKDEVTDAAWYDLPRD